MPAYNCLYLVEPGESVLLEAQPDAVGLKVGVVYDVTTDTQEILYQRFSCKNESILNVSELVNDDISWYGGEKQFHLVNFHI